MSADVFWDAMIVPSFLVGLGVLLAVMSYLERTLEHPASPERRRLARVRAGVSNGLFKR